jgi:quinol monooxygenase YgiN
MYPHPPATTTTTTPRNNKNCIRTTVGSTRSRPLPRRSCDRHSAAVGNCCWMVVVVVAGRIWSISGGVLLVVITFFFLFGSTTNTILRIPNNSMSTEQQPPTIGAVVDHETQHQQQQQPPPFSLLVTLLFTELPYKEQFLSDITPLCQYIQKYESNTTLSYEVLMSDTNPLQVLILERYVDKEVAFLQIHRTSDEFVQFRTKLQSMQQQGYVTVNGASYYDSGIGYIHH